MSQHPHPSAPVSKTRIVKIESLNKKGAGIGESETGGQLVVPFTIPGETVRVEKFRRKGRLLEVMQPSPHRITPVCRHFQHCGGCSWQHIDYPYQLQIKIASVNRHWQAHGIDTSAFPIHTETSAPFHYRNRMDFVWWYDGSFGLREKGKWHSVVDLNECRLLPPHAMDTALTLHRRARQLGLPFRDQKKKKPGLRYLVIRCGIFTSEIMLNIVSDPIPLSPSLWADLDHVVSVYQLINNNPERDTSDGEPLHLDGQRGYHEIIESHAFLVQPNVFFQPNPAIARKMVQTLRNWIQEDTLERRRFVDLYCGVGMFTILLADLFQHTRGVEVVESSIRLARQNAGDAGIDFHAADAVAVEEAWLRDVDVLLVDPPREGLSPKVIQTIQNTLPHRLIYVSCHPQKCIEDIAQLSERYAVRRIAYFDQFPQTPHVEMLVMLERK